MSNSKVKQVNTLGFVEEDSQLLALAREQCAKLEFYPDERLFEMLRRSYNMIKVMEPKVMFSFAIEEEGVSFHLFGEYYNTSQGIRFKPQAFEEAPKGSIVKDAPETK